VQRQTVYLAGDPTGADSGILRQSAYAVGDAIDVTGMQTALVCVQIQLSYDPFGLSEFSYRSNDSAIQSQTALFGR